MHWFDLLEINCSHFWKGIFIRGCFLIWEALFPSQFVRVRKDDQETFRFGCLVSHISFYCDLIDCLFNLLDTIRFVFTHTPLVSSICNMEHALLCLVDTVHGLCTQCTQSAQFAASAPVQPSVFHAVLRGSWGATILIRHGLFLARDGQLVQGTIPHFVS